jgi:hypothetical protein
VFGRGDAKGSVNVHRDLLALTNQSTFSEALGGRRPATKSTPIELLLVDQLVENSGGSKHAGECRSKLAAANHLAAANTQIYISVR